MNDTCVGLLLAGGRSSRMGRDKAQLDFHGRPLWQHVAGVMRAGGCSDVLVSGPAAGGFADDTPGIGPLGGLQTALRRLPDTITVLLVVPVDLPRLTAAAVATLATAAPGAAAVHFRDHPLPVRLRLDAALHARLAALLADPDPRRHAVHALLAGLDTVALPAPAGDALANANTPEDWARALGPHS